MLVSIILLISFALFTFLFSLLNLGTPWWWFLYVFLGFVGTLAFTLVMVGILLIYFKFAKYDNKFKHNIAWHLLEFVRIVMRIKVDVVGKENIPNETFVVYGNHKSMLDIVIVYCVYHKVMSAVAKKNLIKVPVLNLIMRDFEVVPLDRENEREGVKALLHAIDLVKKGYNMIIFPEGGIKTREYETMVGFKAGAFKLATKANATISPVSIIGSSKIHLNYPLHRSKIKFIIHEPIKASEYQDLNTFDLGEKVQKIIDDGVLNG